MQFATPTYLLSSNGTPLGAATHEWIRSVECNRTSDGADVLTIECDAWDPIRADFRMVDERPLFPGNDVVLRAGYGPANLGSPDLACFGKFRMDSRDPSYESNGPSVTFVGYDGLQRFMECTDARVIEAIRVSEVIEKLLKDYPGIDIDTIPSPPLPPTAPLGASTQAPTLSVQPTPKHDKMQQYCKRRGVTDLAWIKGFAEGLGWAYPKVRYDEKNDREILIFRPAIQGPDAWTQTWWYRKPGGDGSLISFKPSFSKDAPTGVEIVGWDQTKGVPMRVIARVRPSGEPDVRFDNNVIVSEKIQKEIKSGAALRLSVIGSGETAVKLKPVKVGKKAWSPEIGSPEELTRDMVFGRPDLTAEDMKDIARAYLNDRAAAWWTCSFTLENQQGLQLMDSDQVHEFRGLPSMDEGHFITLRADHKWAGDRHTVSGNGQKLIAVNDQIQIIEQAWGNA